MSIPKASRQIALSVDIAKYVKLTNHSTTQQLSKEVNGKSRPSRKNK